MIRRYKFKKYVFDHFRHTRALFTMLSDTYSLCATLSFADQYYPDTLPDVLNAQRIIKIEEVEPQILKFYYDGGDGRFRTGTLIQADFEEGLKVIRKYLFRDLEEFRMN